MTPHAPEALVEPLVHSLCGLLLGLLTALLLVGLSYSVWPEVKESGQDAGLRLAVALDGAMRRQGGLPFIYGEQEQANGHAYIFLDVDSGAEADSCAALKGSPVPPNAPSLGPPCGISRPINRWLLAEIVRAMAERGAQLVALDIDLTEEGGAIHADEREALRRALRETSDRGTRVIVAAPMQSWDFEVGERSMHFERGDNHYVDQNMPGVREAAVLPWPTDPLRRYPKCVRTDDDRWIPSMPYLTTEWLSGGADAVCVPAAPGDKTSPADEPPRIVYTLPPLTSHQDAVGQDSRGQWLAYRDIWNRCLASNAWNPNLQCGVDAPYRGRVVVVGVSNPARRDRHYTPLGDMAGAEVVVNAMRSFELFPGNHDKSFLQALLSKFSLVLACFPIWFLYYAFAPHVRRHVAKMPKGWRRVRARVLCSGGLFLLALVLVLVLALSLSYGPNNPTPSLDLLIPVLAVGVELYVEWAKAAVDWLERSIKRVFGLPCDHD